MAAWLAAGGPLLGSEDLANRGDATGGAGGVTWVGSPAGSFYALPLGMSANASIFLARVGGGRVICKPPCTNKFEAGTNLVPAAGNTHAL